MSMPPLHGLKLTPEDREALHAKLEDRHVTLAAIQQWLRSLGYHVNRGGLRRYAVHTGLRKIKPGRFLRVDRILSDEHRAEYQQLIACPRTTTRQARLWLKERGYRVGHAAVHLHRNRTVDKLDDIKESAQIAESIVLLAREHGQAAMSNGMLTRFEQLVLEQLLLLSERDKMNPKDLTELSKSVMSAVGSRERFEEMRREFEEAKRKAAEGATTAAKAGATPAEVADRVKEILGV